jgi:hypothetical protein
VEDSSTLADTFTNGRRGLNLTVNRVCLMPVNRIVAKRGRPIFHAAYPDRRRAHEAWDAAAQPILNPHCGDAPSPFGQGHGHLPTDQRILSMLRCLRSHQRHDA